ncbi:MAG: hypothetical protein IJV40_07260 [Oscillospiraceae bacterium]|nr:hypothetical protein [Oscillospiraceae bacterium]
MITSRGGFIVSPIKEGESTTSRELREYQRQLRLEAWEKYLAEIDDDTEEADVPPYTKPELYRLWLSFKNSKEAPEMLAGFAACELPEARAMIEEFESGLVTSSESPEKPFLLSREPETEDTTTPPKPPKRKRMAKKQLPQPLTETPARELTLLQVVIAENSRQTMNRLAVVSLPLCELYCIQYIQNHALKELYFSSADDALVYAKSLRQIRLFRNISADALRDYL